MANQTKTSVDTASPGPLDNEKKWKNWENKFVNYARSHIKESGVPLSYVICENEDPYINSEHPNFINKTVACEISEGGCYAAERMSVFNTVVSYTTGQTSSDWIKIATKHSYGQ